MADIRNTCLGRITQGAGNMIRIDEIWLSTQPMDMRAGMDTAMAQIMKAFGSIKPHCAYLFCNKRGHRMKVLVHDGLGIWLCARRLEQGKFHWAQVHQGETVALSPEQLQALIQGLPWQRIGRQQVVTMLETKLDHSAILQTFYFILFMTSDI